MYTTYVEENCTLEKNVVLEEVSGIKLLLMLFVKMILICAFIRLTLYGINNQYTVHLSQNTFFFWRNVIFVCVRL